MFLAVSVSTRTSQARTSAIRAPSSTMQINGYVYIVSVFVIVCACAYLMPCVVYVMQVPVYQRL